MPLVTIFCEKENFLKNFVKKELHKNRGDGKKVYLGGIFLHPILVEIVYMMKKVLMLASAFTAGAFAANSLQVSLDVVVRDFQPSHPDFENFSEESVKHSNEFMLWAKPGYDTDWLSRAAYHNTCGNKVSKQGVALGKDGLPWVVNPLLPAYLQTQTTLPGSYLTYGQCKQSSIPGVENQRGFGANSAAQFTGVQKNTCSGGMFWENEVYYTPGMVQPYLEFDRDSVGDPVDYLRNVHIKKGNDACDNFYFAQWFEDIKDVNKRTETTMDIPAAADNPKYKELNYNYNNGGYFPLDIIDSASQQRIGPAPGDQWGPQSFSIFCPPYNYEYANDQTDFLNQNTAALCGAWNQNGGAKALSPDAASNIAVQYGTLGLQHLRNYNFTMMGYANFKYYKENNTGLPDALGNITQEIFEFAGDDDMWIFVDGVLAVDLGGTHLATPGIVNIRTLAENNHGCHPGEPLATTLQKKGACGADGKWADGQWHHLHFFYADRQSDGSNLYIRANLAEVAASQFGQPRILEAELLKNEQGNFETYFYSSSELNDASVQFMNAANGQYFPIVVKRGKTYLAYQITSLAYNQRTSKGYQYKLTGKLCTDPSCAVTVNPAFGDSLTYNYVESSEHPDAAECVFKNTFNVTSKNVKEVDTYNLGPVTTVTMSQTTTVIPADNTIDRPPFDDKKLPSGELSDKETGEIVISVLPEEYSNSDDQGAWIAENIKKITAAPGGSDPSSAANSQIINSNTKNSATGAGSADNARCATVGDVENCVSFSFVTDQAFRVNVRVFDHLGHFVNQYNQAVSQEQFNAITGSYAPSGECSALDPATVSGSIAASVKMYPVSKDGRKLGTGAYIYQVSLVEFPQPHCVKTGAELQYIPGTYRRTEYKQTRGFRRITGK